MTLLGRLMRVRTLLIIIITIAFCAAAYNFVVSRSWSDEKAYVHVNIEEILNEPQPVKHDRDLLGGVPDDLGGDLDEKVELNPPADDNQKVVHDPPDREGMDDLNVDKPDNTHHQMLNHEPNPDEFSKDNHALDNEEAVGKDVHIRFVEDEEERDRGEGDGGGGEVEEEVKKEEPVDKGEKKNAGHGQDASAFISQLSEAGMTGMLNYDVWRWIVGYTVDDMRIDKSFPNFPDERKTINRLRVEFNEADPQDIKGKYSHKIYGYLLPPEKGDYQFSIEMIDVTAAGCVELWLSNGSDPLHIQKILVLDYDDMRRPMPRRATYKRSQSPSIRLDTQAYYFEYLQKSYEGKVTVDIKWKVPHSKEFIELDFRTLAMAAKFNEEGKFTYGPSINTIMKGHLRSNDLQAHRHIQFVGDFIYPISEIDVLPPCEFKPSFAYPRKVGKYQGVWQVFDSRVYPKDQTWFKNWHRKDMGNTEIKRETVDKIVSLYTKAFNASKQYKGEILKLRYLEETANSKVPSKKNRRPEPIGHRYLLELNIHLHQPVEKVIYTSEYVYLPKDSSELCHTSNFQWKKTPVVDVYFVVSLKNLGVWVDHLIHNFENIYASTRDDNFELILVDYNSQDMDVEDKLKKSTIGRWHIIKKNGSFSRSGGLQAGIDYVKNPDSIVMTIDMHLTLPTGFVEYIRRHTIQGKTACTPFFFRLNKGYTEINFNGFWETLTYGLFSMFKSDWVNFGGFDLEHYKDKWGGEDWDVLDRSLAKGYEMFRIRYPGLVHYHHTKAGMWGVDGAKSRPR